MAVLRHEQTATLANVAQGLSIGKLIFQALARVLGLQYRDVGAQCRRQDRVARARVDGHLNFNPTFVFAFSKWAEAEARGLLAT